MIINPKRKIKILQKTSQGYMNGSVPTPPLTDFMQYFKKHLGIDSKKIIYLLNYKIKLKSKCI